MLPVAYDNAMDMVNKFTGKTFDKVTDIVSTVLKEVKSEETVEEPIVLFDVISFAKAMNKEEIVISQYFIIVVDVDE